MNDPALDSDEAEALAKKAALLAADNFTPTTIAEGRAQHERLLAWWNEGGPEIASEPVVIDEATGLDGLLYRAPKPQAPILIYMHGGGWVRGSAASSDCTARALAEASGWTILNLNYRLAPEHPYPAALDDADAAIDWCEHHAKELGLLPGAIAVGGGSAGANLALAVSLRRRDRGRSLPFGLALFYGSFQISNFATTSFAAYGQGQYGLSLARMHDYLAQYKPPHADPYAFPLTPSADLRGLPPCWIGPAELDILRDDSTLLAARLAEIGSPHALTIYKGLTHGYVTRTKMVPKARQAIADAMHYLAGLLC